MRAPPLTPPKSRPNIRINSKNPVILAVTKQVPIVVCCLDCLLMRIHRPECPGGPVLVIRIKRCRKLCWPIFYKIPIVIMIWIPSERSKIILTNFLKETNRNSDKNIFSRRLIRFFSRFLLFSFINLVRIKYDQTALFWTNVR